jgi:hypothetical protein
VSFVGYLALYPTPLLEKNGEWSKTSFELCLHGGSHPTVFKTLKNALKAATTRLDDETSRLGAVLALDLALLRVICDETGMRGDPERPPMARRHLPIAIEHPLDPQQRFELAERQALLWTAELERARDDLNAHDAGEASRG